MKQSIELGIDWEDWLGAQAHALLPSESGPEGQGFSKVTISGVDEAGFIILTDVDGNPHLLLPGIAARLIVLI